MSIGDIVKILDSVMRFKLFEINRTAITPSSLLLFVFVLAAFAAASRLIRQLTGHLFSKFGIDTGTQYTFNRIIHYTIIIIGAVVAFQFIGIDLTGLAVIVGFLSVGIGFGLQNVTSNFVAGLILLFERPIKVGDRVTVGDKEGDVMEINMRSTTIRTLNNIAVIVPNSQFVSTTVVNWSYGDQKVRLEIDVGVSYESDLAMVMRSLKEVGEEHREVLKSPAPEVLHVGFGDSSWNMRLRVWIAQPQRHPQIRSEINCAIVNKFRQNGIEIPFPQRDLHVRSPLPLPYQTVDAAP
ncbi:MAG: mechanosensitive ion channel family protein [Alphaproteobacteria bacterium]